MKKVILLLAISPVFVSTTTQEQIEICYEEQIEQTNVDLPGKDIPTILRDRDLLTALILVESRGNDSYW
jgi:hypothetical protein